MTNLLIVRHAIALKREDWNAQGKPDFERPLSERGVEKFKRALAGLKIIVPEINYIYTSELVRARDTASLLADHYGLKIVRDQKFNHGKMPREMCDHLRGLAHEHSDATLVVVGHEPELCILIHLLTGLPLEESYLKKGGAALIESPESEAPRLVWLKKPRELRAIAKK